MHFKEENQKGFSLVEVLIYIAVSSAMLMVVVGFVGWVMRVRNKVSIESKVEQNARYVMARMVNEIRHADDLTVVDQSTLSLTVSDPDKNPTIFDINNGVLYMSQGTGDLIAITGNDVKVGEVLFDDRTTPNSADIVKITLTVSHPDTNLSADSQASIELETYVARR